jgi:hypothetical protein
MTDMQVVFDELMTASKVFHQEGAKFNQIYPKGGIRSPTVSTTELNTALSSILLAIGHGHAAIAASIESYSIKLRRAHDSYRHADLNSRQLMKALQDPDSIK